MMSSEEYESLKTDIKQNGLLQPIWTHEDQIIDGRNRYNACVDLGIFPQYQTWDGHGSLVAFVVSLNLQRRHLSSTQKALVTPRVEGLLSKEAKKRHSEAISKSNQEKPRRTKYQDSYTEIFPELKKDSSVEIFPALKDAPQETLDASKKHGQEQNEARTQAAKLTGTNPHYVTDAKFIINRAPEVADFALKTGKIAMPDAKKIATLPEEQRKVVLGKVEAGEHLKRILGGRHALFRR